MKLHEEGRDEGNEDELDDNEQRTKADVGGQCPFEGRVGYFTIHD